MHLSACSVCTSWIENKIAFTGPSLVNTQFMVLHASMLSTAVAVVGKLVYFIVCSTDCKAFLPWIGTFLISARKASLSLSKIQFHLSHVFFIVPIQGAHLRIPQEYFVWALRDKSLYC
jgi:hypothetical protein